MFHLHIGNVCKYDDGAIIARWGYIVVDLIISIFVTFRLILILKEGIQETTAINQITERSSKERLLSAVNYWNYLQLGTTLIFNILAVVEIITWLKYGSILTIRIFQNINNIVFSYLITNDKEIVRLIAGETVRAKYFNSLVKNLRNKSVTISFKDNLKLEELDNNTIISNKRMTFFEWGSMVGLSINNLNDEELIIE
ncbi:hypothetical protein RclHR1_00870021 [Rhizophagus clarus]|uniref:Uncharacterized protein n=1 Tax=Rhizophagus clarus TaxID=94130 RepID=A0A2Z6SFX4_9GLOM|nr:hypothetical protein RclHR1_00870021 [Rhizophagus clarus]GES82346.1 hypothetical protein GLOIN_2v1778313 [Rhizophagus clarus]